VGRHLEGMFSGFGASFIGKASRRSIMLLQVLRRLGRLRFPSLSRACLQQRFLFFSACKPKKNPKKNSQFFGFGMNTATLRMSGLGNLSRSMRTGRTGRSQVIIPQQSLAASATPARSARPRRNTMRRASRAAVS
jgi:hypothetical protein